MKASLNRLLFCESTSIVSALYKIKVPVGILCISMSQLKRSMSRSNRSRCPVRPRHLRTKVVPASVPASATSSRAEPRPAECNQQQEPGSGAGHISEHLASSQTPHNTSTLRHAPHSVSRQWSIGFDGMPGYLMWTVTRDFNSQVALLQCTLVPQNIQVKVSAAQNQKDREKYDKGSLFVCSFKC